jgi:hypothetical protein
VTTCIGHPTSAAKFAQLAAFFALKASALKKSLFHYALFMAKELEDNGAE